MAPLGSVAAASPGDGGCAAWSCLDHYWVRRPSCSGRFSIALSSNNGLPGTPNQRLPALERIHPPGIHSRRLRRRTLDPEEPHRSSGPSFASLRSDNPDRKGPLGEVRSIAKDRGGFDSRAVVGRPAGGLCCSVGKQWSEGRAEGNGRVESGPVTQNQIWVRCPAPSGEHYADSATETACSRLAFPS